MKGHGFFTSLENDTFETAPLIYSNLCVRKNPQSYIPFSQRATRNFQQNTFSFSLLPSGEGPGDEGIANMSDL